MNDLKFKIDRQKGYACLINKCKSLLNSDKNCMAAHFCLARVYSRKSEYNLAMLHGKKVVELNPQEPNGFLNLGLIYEGLNRFKNAVSCYKKELSFNRSNGAAHYNLAYLYFHRRQWKRASAHFEQCIKLKFRFREEFMIFDLGRCYVKRNDLTSYLRTYTAYFKREPTKGWVAVNLGGALLDAGRLSEAYLMVETAERLGKDCRFKGKLLKKMAQKRKATAYCANEK